jgi:hypothetical protein
MKNLSACLLYHFLLFCVGKISIEISNDENKVNSVLSRFFYAIWASAFWRLAWLVSCGPFRTELVSKHQGLVYALKFVAYSSSDECGLALSPVYLNIV